VRTNTDDRYFTDTFQAMPKHGYTKMFEAMLDHPDISVELGVDFAEVRERGFAHVVYTGPIDAYFDHCYGALPYRSIRFEHEHLPDIERYQETGTVNYPNDHAFTRITEFKHLTGQSHPGTSIVREYPQADGEPYYPVPRAENELLFKRYEELAKKERGVTFVGRLAQYRYYNMDQVVGAALAAAKRLTD
jgi:UDP-galactopyranose mutase